MQFVVRTCQRLNFLMIDEPMCATASWRHGEKLGQSFRSMRCIEPSGDTIASPPYIYNPNSRAAREQMSRNISSLNGIKVGLPFMRS